MIHQSLEWILLKYLHCDAKIILTHNIKLTTHSRKGSTNCQSTHAHDTALRRLSRGRKKKKRKSALLSPSCPSSSSPASCPAAATAQGPDHLWAGLRIWGHYTPSSGHKAFEIFTPGGKMSIKIVKAPNRLGLIHQDLHSISKSSESEEGAAWEPVWVALFVQRIIVVVGATRKRLWQPLSGWILYAWHATSPREESASQADTSATVPLVAGCWTT